VLAADRWARRSYEAALVQTTIAQLDGWQDDEAERAK